QATTVAAETQLLTGILQARGDVDWFRITATEAMPLLMVTRTREVGSPADIVLELFNSDGGKIVENDDAGPRDAELSAQLPAAGDYFLKVSEIAGRGGSEWSYALDVFRNRKAVRVTAPVDRLNVPRGGSAAMPLSIRRIHYDGPLMIEAVDLPAALKMNPFTIGGKQSTVPVVLTAADPAASSSDADWGPLTFRIMSPDGSTVAASELQLAPPPPKKNDNELFRSARLRNDLFLAVAPAAQFSLAVDQPSVTVTQGMSAMVTIRSTRAADWTMPIEIALATPADQLPPGVTVTAGSMAAGELAVTINAVADAAVGPFTVFLQGKAKKDNVEPIHPVPPIVVEVKAK
ncbi:MAG: PPC domain-containing protein, partial [Planctomycetota bacterium]